MNPNHLLRIRNALLAVYDEILRGALQELLVEHEAKGPTTNLDRQVNALLQRILPRESEGWLSEETRDDAQRLSRECVWIVDPIDGTRELIEGIPEWCVSVGFVQAGQALAGGVLNPSTGELFLGSRDTGLQVLSIDARQPAEAFTRSRCVLVSRKEHREGKWNRFERSTLQMVPLGSIAYRLARVAAGYADATCTFESRYEWDVAGGVALVMASGGSVCTATGEAIRFNAPVPLLPSFFAFAKSCCPTIPSLLRSDSAA